MMGQPTPRICLENSCWRIRGMKVMLGWQSICMKTQCLCNIWTPHPQNWQITPEETQVTRSLPAEMLACRNSAKSMLQRLPKWEKVMWAHMVNLSWKSEDSSLIFPSIDFMLPLVGNLHLYRLFQTLGSKMALLAYMYRVPLCISSLLCRYKQNLTICI